MIAVTSLAGTVASIPAADDAAARRTARRLEAKAKPPGSLGGLESLACRLAAIRGRVPGAELTPAIVVAAGDHGVWEEGVSRYPREVTAQMLVNFSEGGAAVSVLARGAGAGLVVVDAGVMDPKPVAGIRSAVVEGQRGTRNIVTGPAMPATVAEGLIEEGIALAAELTDDGIDLIGVGDMGIANTTVASALCATLLPATPASACGPGTGLDEAGVGHKVAVVEAALAANGLLRDGDTPDPLHALAAMGGLEIAFLVGVILGAAARRVPVLLDGFVTGAAALVAVGLASAANDALIAATRSPEPGHRLVLDRLGLDPLLDLGLRLGEGSAAALAVPLVRSAGAIVERMATFESAGVGRA
ncbi:MAG TPA: nicotinate-nucleotide--dimethylbenzimidazole phosphoribosyltransferase [Actinomycetota bacterium]|nr:nicotinate-nucleotide--dimethylbenzimidazole phosphoribosyltransferase [Actinomycetota bacterium]